jgi:hypothetical protein
MTPLRWAKWLVRENNLAAKWIEGATICDPTAGRGAFAHALIDVACENNVDVTNEMLSRIFLIEREPTFIKEFRDSFELKYSRKFPTNNFTCADIVLENPRHKFDFLVGNPPWVNFNDLPHAYKERLKSAFITNGLIEDNQSLLLGCARVDFSALVLSVAIRENLKHNGQGIFFVPLSLFQNDGAHSGFRRYSVGEIIFRPSAIWNFAESEVFPDISTRFGVVRFERDKTAEYPIPYHVESGRKWVKRLAAPIGESNAPLAVFDVAHEYERASCPVTIEVRENQKPRQGVNTCGANEIFIFNEEPDLSKNFTFPLITKECFREENPSPHKYIVLPYDMSSGRPLEETALRSIPKLFAHFSRHKNKLCARKGTLLNTWTKRGVWWACLGVGEYNFAPFKIVWEAYGKTNFRPRIFGSHNGKPWQANQAMHAFIPCWSFPEAENLLQQLENSNIEGYLKSLNIEGTCNWAQPGRIKRFLQFMPDMPQPALELRF